PPPRPRRVFADCLPEPPAETRPVVELIGQMDGGSQMSATEVALSVAMEEHGPTGPGPASFLGLLVHVIGLLVGWGLRAGVALPEGPLKALKAWLLVGADDWKTRALKVMGVIGASPIGEGMVYLPYLLIEGRLKEMRERPGGPPWPKELD